LPACNAVDSGLDINLDRAGGSLGLGLACSDTALVIAFVGYSLGCEAVAAVDEESAGYAVIVVNHEDYSLRSCVAEIAELVQVATSGLMMRNHNCSRLDPCQSLSIAPTDLPFDLVSSILEEFSLRVAPVDSAGAAVGSRIVRASYVAEAVGSSLIAGHRFERYVVTAKPE